MKAISYALALMAAFITAKVWADEPIQPSVYWRAEFGHHSPVSLNYGLSLRQTRAERLAAALPALATLDFTSRGTAATLAGLPLWRKQYRLNEGEDTPESESGWLPSTNTLLIAGGVVAVVALLSSDDEDEEPGGFSGGPEGSPCVVEGVFGCMVQCPEGTVEGCLGALSAASLASSVSMVAPQTDGTLTKK